MEYTRDTGAIVWFCMNKHYYSIDVMSVPVGCIV